MKFVVGNLYLPRGIADPPFLVPTSAHREAQFESWFGLQASLVVDAYVITKELNMTSNTHIDYVVPHAEDEGRTDACKGPDAVFDGQQAKERSEAHGWRFGLSVRGWFRSVLWSGWLVACLSRSPVGEELQPKLKDECASL